MRFDLRRVPPETMTAHLVDLLGKEGIGYEPEALAMIVRAGEGSVRDSQSLLDQAISHGDGKVTAATVKAMLGLGDRARSIDLFEALMRGDIADALALLRELYDAGADPETVVGDLADFTNLVTRIKIVPAAADDVSLTPDERTRGAGAGAEARHARAEPRLADPVQGHRGGARPPAMACRPPRWCWCASPMPASCRAPTS